MQRMCGCVQYLPEREYYQRVIKGTDKRFQKTERTRLLRYGLNEGEFLSMLHTQAGVCAICKEREATDVDHCHETGVVRGLLCGKCNTGLGMFCDSEELLNNAICYLKGY